MKRLLTIRKNNKLDILNKDQLYKDLFENFPDGLFLINVTGELIDCNEGLEIITGISKDQLLYSHFSHYIHPEDLFHVKKYFHYARNCKIQEKEFRILHKDGTIRYVSATAVPAKNADKIFGVYGVVKDITDKINLEQEIYRMAFYDYLTGLPNRFMLETRLSEKIEESISLDKRIAVLLIDLDRFNVVNDSMGHHVGDLLLKEVTGRLQETIADKGVLYRQGGDEFIIILNEADRETAAMVSKRIVSSMVNPFTIHSIEIFTSPSIGITMIPEDGDSADQILRNADFAMYQAKRNGKNRYHYYSPPTGSHLLNPLKMEMELHRAVERDELTLHYQPKINLKTGEIVGVEALIRWNHPEWGMVSPGDFIPLAEETGLIISIGEWAIQAACQQNKRWLSKGFSTVVSVNLSTRQFSQMNLVPTIEKILVETGLDPQLLELEITESMTANIEQSIKTLNELKSLGVKISIDDFGTGFSSLNYLTKFPVDSLKIDQSFVRELSNNSSDKTIVKTIISMAHNLNLNIVAEGVETKEQLLFLQQHLCNEGQGFLFSKPLPAIELEKRIQDIKQTVK